MCLQNGIRRESLFQKRLNLFSQFFGFQSCNVISGPGIYKSHSVFTFGFGWIVNVFVKATTTVIAAPVACSGGTIPTLTGKLFIVFTFREAFPAIFTVFVIGAFTR
jgi:hypothetical protein